MNRTPENGIGLDALRGARAFLPAQPLLDQLFTESAGSSWGLLPDDFAAALAMSAAKHFSGETPAPAQLRAYFSTLHLRDLALACACAQGHSSAWDFFVSTFRPSLRSAAGAILRCPPDSPASCELADSLFADLFGLGQGPTRSSLFRYFHGRSSLKTWLRSVLAQRHIDSLRASRRFTDIDATDGDPSTSARPPAANSAPAGFLADPHRAELVALFHRALEVALSLLDPRDSERLRLYYAAEETLAAIGRELGEHESTVSRNLDRTRHELRAHVEAALRKGAASPYQPATRSGLSDAQIALCFQYVAEDSPIDLDQLLPDRKDVRNRESRKT